MSQAPSPKPKRFLCPACDTPFVIAHGQCPKCGLKVAQMKSLLAAKRAAEAKGIATTTVERASPQLIDPPQSSRIGIDPSLLKFGAALLVLLAVSVGIYFWIHRSRPPFYLALPATRQAVAEQLLAHVATGENPEYAKAYALVAPSARDPNDSDEEGHYYGLYHALYKYLTGEFGDTWNTTTKIAPDPQDPDTLIATIAGLETLHIHVAQQVPADKLAQDHEHYALINIDEFDIHDAAGFQQMEGVMGVVGGTAGNAAVDNIKKVLGASGHLRQTPMAIKVNQLPIVRNPREVSRQALILLWPVRKDPVVRARLDQISTDGRYDPIIQKTAEDVLKGNISDEELIAVGVQ